MTAKKFFILLLASVSQLLFTYKTAAAETTQVGGNSAPASNQSFTNIAIKSFINLDSFEGSISGYELTCEQGQNQKIGFCGGECDGNINGENGARISAQCAASLDAFLPQCLEAIGCTHSAAFCGVGGYAKRKANVPGGGSQTPSRHSTGDALDLAGLRCKDANGENRDIDFSKAGREKNMRSRGADAAANVSRYDKFVQCWRAQVVRYQELNQMRGGGAISCQGSAPPTNELHNDHVHISCPVPRKNVATI